MALNASDPSALGFVIIAIFALVLLPMLIMAEPIGRDRWRQFCKRLGLTNVPAVVTALGVMF